MPGVGTDSCVLATVMSLYLFICFAQGFSASTVLILWIGCIVFGGDLQRGCCVFCIPNRGLYSLVASSTVLLFVVIKRTSRLGQVSHRQPRWFWLRSHGLTVPVLLLSTKPVHQAPYEGHGPDRWSRFQLKCLPGFTRNTQQLNPRLSSLNPHDCTVWLFNFQLWDSGLFYSPKLRETSRQ